MRSGAGTRWQQYEPDGDGPPRAGPHDRRHLYLHVYGPDFLRAGLLRSGICRRHDRPSLLSRLGIDLKDVETKAREDVRKKQESDRAYQRYVENQIAWKAIEDERAIRRAEAEAAKRAEEETAAREIARKERLDLEALRLGKAASPAVQCSEPREICQSSVAVAYPVVIPHRHSIARPREHRLEVFSGRSDINGHIVPLQNGGVALNHDGRALISSNQTLPAAPRINPQVNASGNHWAPAIHR